MVLDDHAALHFGFEILGRRLVRRLTSTLAHTPSTSVHDALQRLVFLLTELDAHSLCCVTKKSFLIGFPMQALAHAQATVNVCSLVTSVDGLERDCVLRYSFVDHSVLY